MALGDGAKLYFRVSSKHGIRTHFIHHRKKIQNKEMNAFYTGRECELAKTVLSRFIETARKSAFSIS